MSSLYQIVVPQWTQFLESTIDVIEKAEAWGKENGKTEKELANSRLSPDMLPVGFQVNAIQKAVFDFAAGVCGMEKREWRFKAESESLAEVKADVRDLIQYLKTIPANSTDGKEAQEVETRTKYAAYKYPAATAVLLNFVPNFFFHVTTIYANFRALGVPLGKDDFLGATHGPKWRVE